MPTKPHSSPYVGSETAGVLSFGYGWRELASPLEGYRIHVVDGRVQSVHNLVDAMKSEASASADEGRHQFMLLPGEFVCRVDVEVTKNGVSGLRLQTNKRVSQWYGQHGQRREVFEAPSGCCIKLLRGNGDNLRCHQLGVHYSPIEVGYEDAEKPHGVLFSQAVRPLGTSSPHAVAFESQCSSVAAVVVTCSGLINKIEVLSTRQYATLVASDEVAVCEPNEHWFVMVEDEKIERVEVQCSASSMDAVRVVTNLRESLWFGFLRKGRTTTSYLDCKDKPRGTSICGFHGQRLSGTVESLGVVYAVPPIKIASRNHVVAANAGAASKAA